jgi:hypothetical protein
MRSDPSVKIFGNADLWPFQERSVAPPATSQQRCCRLREALYSRAPEGLKASAVTGSVSPASVLVTLPVAGSTN